MGAVVSQQQLLGRVVSGRDEREPQEKPACLTSDAGSRGAWDPASSSRFLLSVPARPSSPGPASSVGPGPHLLVFCLMLWGAPGRHAAACPQPRDATCLGAASPAAGLGPGAGDRALTQRCHCVWEFFILILGGWDEESPPPGPLSWGFWGPPWAFPVLQVTAVV